MKKIYVKEWMLFQPYDRQDEVDTYYVNVANQIAACLKDFVGGRYPEHSVHGNCHLFDALVSGCDFTDRNLASIL